VLAHLRPFGRTISLLRLLELRGDLDQLLLVVVIEIGARWHVDLDSDEPGEKQPCSLAEFRVLPRSVGDEVRLCELHDIC
jgi:hypothetical protein